MVRESTKNKVRGPQTKFGVVTNYSVGDFLIRVKNAAIAKNKELVVRSNKEIVGIAKALKKMGYLAEISESKEGLGVSLSFKDKKPIVMDIKLVSKPGRRIYMKVTEIEKRRGPSQFIISTPKGILSSKEAIKARTGGEVLAEVW